MWPTAEDELSLLPATAQDFDALLALRIRAMQPSLEALGRFDAARARERFASNFMAEHMFHLMLRGQRVGCASLRPKPGALRIDHLYIEPAHHNQGLGAWVMDWACSSADLRQQPLELAALQGSAANRFYQRHGFVEIDRSDFDIEYRRAVAASPLQVVRQLWTMMQARDWAGVRALLDDALVIDWWATGERIQGADTYVRLQAEYPEGWQIHLQGLQALQDGRVLSLVRVVHAPLQFLAQSLHRVRQGRIALGQEWWATCEAPPLWRTPERFPGLTRLSAWALP